MTISILAIDDSPVQRSLYRFFLGKQYALTLASEGYDALEKSQKGTFNIIITDVNLPCLNGIELTKRFRNQEHHKNAVIVVVSSDLAGIKQAMEQGANYFLLKPIQPQNLVDFIKKLIKKNFL